MNLKTVLKESSFKSDTVGGGISFGYDIFDRLHHSIFYSYKDEDINNLKSDASIYVKAQEGRKIASLIGHGISYDKLDDIESPKNGYIIKLNQRLSGLGGDKKYIESRVTASYYHPIFQDRAVLKHIR